MLRITLRDLQWRARRFAVSILATALVFATTLLLAGVYQSLLDETTRTLGVFDAERWVVPAGVPGPFTADSPMPADTVDRLEQTGVRAAGIQLFRHVVRGPAGDHDVNVIGYRPAGFVDPPLSRGREPSAPGEVVVDERVEAPLGARLEVAKRRLRVVGVTHGLTYFGGTPAMLVTARDAQEIAFGGQPMVSAVLLDAAPRRQLAGLRYMPEAAVRDDLRRPLRPISVTLAIVALILWVIAAGIIGLMVYLSGLDRLVDFAVFKSMGVHNRVLLVGVILQALLLALVAAGLASAAAALLAPAFPIELGLSLAWYAGLVGLAVTVALAASVVSVRQAAKVQPALAFGRH